jgi:hypothetical protein
MKREHQTVVFFVSLFVTLVLVGAIFCPINSSLSAQNVSQACGISGILLRADGSVIVDGWKDYSASRIANPNAPMPTIESRDLPNTIHLGKNLVPKTLICFEEGLGSHCVTIEQLRKVK